MYKLFCEQYNGTLDVKYKMYYNIFMTSFNLGFGNPRKDICSFCVKKKASIRIEQDRARKQELVTELLVHKVRSRQFYSKLREEQDNSVLTICFDLMQNQALPKSPIGEAYYARQLWLYFLGMMRHRPGEQQKDDVYFYTWGEHQQARGANQVASALVHFVDQELSPNDHGIKTIRLFSDSCSGQNKNYTVLSTLNMLASKHKVSFQHVFPVRGHSYMPADRAFGRVEQILRAKETILLPEEYYAAFEEVGHVIKYGTDWGVFDFKKVADANLKKPPTFKITETKIREVAPPPAPLTVKNFYNAGGCQHTLLKRGKNWRALEAAPLDDTDCVKLAKKRDVKGLLIAMGQENNEEIKAFYDPICRTDEDAMETDDSDDEDEATVDINDDNW
ncbi:uncharacterized protein [Amphiura filiformis]|uniref:uncharacterized protein n=1 Tax=Amphiura filiformis TaxID=82378 RepID=UPI003B21FF5D